MITKSMLSFAAIGMLVVLVAVTLLWANKQNEIAANSQTQTLQRLDAADDLLFDLTDAETRAYIDSGNESLLPPYLHFRDTIKPQLGKLRQLGHDNPEQKLRLDALYPLIDEKIALLEQSIISREPGSAAALETQKKLQGKQLMDTIRTRMREFHKAETDLLALRETQFRASQNHLSKLILLANLFFVLLLMFGSFLLYRETSRRIASKTRANGLLEQAHQTLHASAVQLAQFKYTLDHTLDGVFIFHPDTLAFSYVNQGAAQQTGYSNEALLQMSLPQINPDCQSPAFQDRLQQLIAGDLASVTFETHHRHKSGDGIDVEIVLQHVEGEEPCFVAFSRDITARKQAEAELRIAAVAFETQESLLITDANGVILRVNQAFVQSSGYSCQEAIGNTPRLLKSGRHDADFYTAMWQTLLQTGKWQGKIWDRRSNGDIFPKWLTITAVKDANDCVSHYIGSYIDITERKKSEEEIRNLAFFDPLTHLPNRRLLLDRLQQALTSSARSGRHGSLMFLDLDHFKNLNDTLGHDYGDLLLQQVALRIASCLRESDTVARLGGDEFVVMLEDLSKNALEASSLTQAVGDKILTVLRQPYQLASHEYHSTPSIGATLFNSEHQTIAELLKKADIAMYQSKKDGRNTLRFFDPDMQITLNARATLEAELYKALENQQFLLHYQIQMDSSHRILGAEALIRWEHPDRGLLSPDQFITLAEETGLILPVGLWVLDTACAQLRLWQQNEHTADLLLAINVSSKQFHHRDFVAQVESAVQRHALNPSRLNIELTEQLLLEDNSREILSRLKKVGVKLSLDNFGSGYSSLKHLKNMPLDQIKIDRSFISNFDNDKAVVRAIITMAKSLDMDIIAEGVELEEQMQRLMDKGCMQYQGYLFGKPVPIEELEKLLRQR